MGHKIYWGWSDIRQNISLEYLSIPQASWSQVEHKMYWCQDGMNYFSPSLSMANVMLKKGLDLFGHESS